MFRKYFCSLVLPICLLSGCNRQEQRAMRGSLALGNADNIAKLSDEFDSAKSLASWPLVYKQEGGEANQLERFDIGKTQAGMMLMMPYASTWYQDYRGVLAYKTVKGDFVMTTKLRVNRRGGEGPPRVQFSLAGLMVRTPRNITPQTWKPGTENYVFLALGAADNPGHYQLEAKTTVNSDSQLQMFPVESGEAVLQIARIGSSLLLLQNMGGGWVVQQRYDRPDFPEAVQAGMTCYTDWPTAHSLSPQQHNATVLRNGSPDLVVLYDYVRFRRPKVPANLAGKRLDDRQAVSDQELLRFLGGAAK